MGDILEFRTVNITISNDTYIEDIRENQFIVKNNSLYSWAGEKFVRKLRDDEIKIIEECVVEMLPF